MCQVQILSVSGIVPAGTTAPTQLRVAGLLSQCPSGQVVVSSSITAASPPTSPTFGMLGNGFIVVLPITAANVACGDTVNVLAECYQRTGCQVTYSGPLECCAVRVSWFDAVVIPGALTPSQIRVSGTSLGCTVPPHLNNEPIIVRVTFQNGATALSGPTPADALTGAYVASIAVPTGTPVQCDDRIGVEAWCSTNNACTSGVVSGRLDCPQCARAQVSIANAGACVGTPPRQPITLGATINIPKGTRFFRWNYGDGSMSPVFQIDNTGGGATTPYIVPPYPPTPPNPPVTAHNYLPGTYTAELIVTDAQGSPLECDRIPLTVVASCGGQCPSIAVSASTPGPCVNGKRTVTLQTTINSLPANTALQWSFGDGQQGTAKPATATGTWPSPPDPTVNVHEYSPGTWTATLTNVLYPGCPAVTVTVTVDPCPTPCCPQVTLDPPQVTGCAPGSVVASFNANLSFMTGCMPVAPSSFEWTLHTPAGARFQKSTTLPATDTTAGWRDPGGNPVTVQFMAAGSYSIGVFAVIPGVSLPCNPTDNTVFNVSACCPQLIGPLNASPKPGDPCTWLFSAQVSNPNNAAVSFVWSFQDGTTATTSVPQTDHTYGTGAPTTGMTTVTLKSPNCPDQSLSVTVTQACVCCPTVTVTASMTTSAGMTPTAMFSASTSWPVGCPPVPPTGFTWALTDRASGVTHTKTTASSTTDETGWTPPLALTAGGGYDLKVTAAFAGMTLPAGCDPSKTISVSAPVDPSTTTTAATTCPWWCWLLGILFISLPISAFVSSYAHCLLGPIGALVMGVVIAASIVIFASICSVCCLWILIVIGLVLAIIAYIVYAIIAAAYGLPAVQLVCSTSSVVSGAAGGLILGIVLWIGFALTAYAFYLACRAISSGSGGSSTSTSSGLTSAGGAGAGRGLRLRPERSGHAVATTIHSERRIGLGDVISGATAALGVAPCPSCRKRAEALNQLLSIPLKPR